MYRVFRNWRATANIRIPGVILDQKVCMNLVLLNKKYPIKGISETIIDQRKKDCLIETDLPFCGPNSIHFLFKKDYVLLEF